MADGTKIVNLSEHIFGNDVHQKPPLPGGRFHNRTGHLFTKTNRNKLFEVDPTSQTKNGTAKPEISTQDSMALVLHSSAKQDTEQVSTQSSKLRRRAQSAKERPKRNVKERNVQQPKSPIVSNRRRPFSANDAIGRNKQNANKRRPVLQDVSALEMQLSVIDLKADFAEDSKPEALLALPDPRDYTYYYIDDLPPMNFSRPSSAKHETFTNEERCCKATGLPKEVEDNLKPSVYGLKRHRQVFGTVHNVTSANLHYEQYPYKLTDFDDTTPLQQYQNGARKLPQTLQPLLPWLYEGEDSLQDSLGVDSNKCLVFLPNVEDLNDLPEVPSEPHTEDEDLPYTVDCTSPLPWNPKKYSHPFTKQPVQEWICKHKSHGNETFDEEQWIKNRNRLYWSKPRRSKDVIRKEISDLEDLLRGIGHADSDCAMVKYQEDVNRLQQMLKETLYGRERPETPEPSDTFGLRKALTDHDRIIAEIQARMAKCRQELAEVEVETGIESDRQYFRKQHLSTL